MAENDVPQGAIPPKISPIAKPEGSAPITPAGAPRPITVRLKPMVRVPSAAAPAAPGLAPVTPAPAVVPPPPVVVPAVDAAAAAPAVVAPVAEAAVLDPVPVQPQPQSPPPPGANPLPDGPKPPSAAQVQAAKSKTSRISLDAAIGVVPDKEGPKTIRLKRPSDLASPATVISKAPIAPIGPASARKTSRIPDSALPIADAPSDDSASVTQKKTLKIKRPGARSDADGDAAATAGDGFPDGVQMTPLSPIDFPEKKENAAFTMLAVISGSIAAVILLLLTLCLGSHAVGPDAGPNSLASISLGQTELPWPGRIAD